MWIIRNRDTEKVDNVCKVVLASGSPRRKELLEQVGIEFEVCAAHGEEIITKSKPCEIVEELSNEKAAEVAELYRNCQENTVVIGADTIVAFGDQILGKPKDEKDAKSALTMLQNQTHQVYTGVTVIVLKNGKAEASVTFFEKTDVSMYPMSQEQIDAYIATKEPLDKAGSYAIQGKCAAYIKGICGDYYNVVGLPVARLIQEMTKLGLKIW